MKNRTQAVDVCSSQLKTEAYNAQQRNRPGETEMDPRNTLTGIQGGNN